ncbi:restriction endonuclease subunit S [Candidatus Microgenomates bacterium]|nr:restriction endonuclease subunit S [Candidatus Microgenomates bacterium]
MPLKQFTVDFSELSQNETIRLCLPFVLPTIQYKYDKINNYLDLCESGKRPKGGIVEGSEGEAISLGGGQINVDGTVDLSKIPYVSYSFYERASKGKIKNEDILICKDGALTGKTCFVDFSVFPSNEVMINEHVYILRGNEKINQKFLFFLTTTHLFQSQIKDLAYRKKAQPGLNSDHFEKIKIPLIPKSTQDQIVAQIEPIEKKIKELKAQIKEPQEIINKIFAREFGFDLKKFEELKKIKNYYLDLSSFGNNKDIRQSVKFHREAGYFVNDELKKVTDKKIKNFISEPIVLGKGVSPSNYDDEGDYYYISMANIKNWKFENEGSTLVSKEYSDKNLNKTVSKNDILIARSGEGTIGKVALIADEDLQGIFADFTMRIRLQNYNHLFAYYYFRTEYFQYLIEINKKGLGNNTNIFPSQIQEFPMIDISLKDQQKIVDEIKTELDKQNEMKYKIESERNKIDEIIEKRIKYDL